MRRITYLLICAVVVGLIATPSDTSARCLYLSKPTNALYISSSYVSGEEISGRALEACLALRGGFDIGFTTTFYDEERHDVYRTKSHEIDYARYDALLEFYVREYILRAGNPARWQLSFFARQGYYMRGLDFSQILADGSPNAIMFGGGVGLRLGGSKAPFFLVYRYDRLLSQTGYFMGNAHNITAVFKFETESGTFILGPKFSHSEGRSMGSVNAGVIVAL